MKPVVATNWRLLDKKHHLGRDGFCSCHLFDCPIGRAVQRQSHAEQDALLPGEPASAPFVSVFVEAP